MFGKVSSAQKFEKQNYVNNESSGIVKQHQTLRLLVWRSSVSLLCVCVCSSKLSFLQWMCSDSSIVGYRMKV